MLSTGAISHCNPCEGQFLSSIFLIPKPNGKHRFILNLKNLNQYIETQHFKLEDLRTAIKLVSENNFMGTVDLKDAYFLIKIHDNYKKYLRFEFDNGLYEFNVLPFGLNTAPFVFTKIMKPVVGLLRSCGFMSSIYLDDLLLIGNSYDDCLENIAVTQQLLSALGFIINKDKCNLSPTTSCKYLGFIIDTKKFQISLPTEKCNKIKNKLNTFRNMSRCKIRDFAGFVGLLCSACPAVEYGWLYTKEFERCKFLNLKNDPLNYDNYMYIPSYLSSDIDWWFNALDNPISKIKYDEYCLEIFSDASTTGWGAACGNETASGAWTVEERSHHINYLEIVAAFFGLKVFAVTMKSCQILLRIDNTTAISYINRMGGIQYPHLTRITKELWEWCQSRNIIVYASYIRSADNTIADAESRRIHPDVEWELSDSVFYTITNTFGFPDVDIFASRVNRKCRNYISWFRDPEAMAINAFTLSWSQIYFYAFPPFSMVLKTLRKIVKDKATGIVVVPLWPTQPWYPLFRKLLVSSVLYFDPNKQTILSPSSNNNAHPRFTLAAGLLSGTRC